MTQPGIPISDTAALTELAQRWPDSLSIGEEVQVHQGEVTEEVPEGSSLIESDDRLYVLFPGETEPAFHVRRD